MSLPHVYILTWCKRIELLYGTTLIFETLRVGFPNASVHVVDAASVAPARAAIQARARACGAQYLQLDRRIELSFFIEQALVRQGSGPAVFVDPDVCFWDSVEEWEFAGLAAGRLIPRHHCEFSGCLSEPRLHTSFLWFPDVARVLQAIDRVRRTHRFFEPFRNVMLPSGDGWLYFDAAAGLYGAYPDQMQPFETRHLDGYDHLFAGTYADSVLARLGPEMREVYRDIHRKAQTDYRLIKGSWRRQEEYFQSRRVAIEFAPPVE